MSAKFVMKSDVVIEKIRRKLESSSTEPAERTVLNVFQFNFTDNAGKPMKSMIFDFKELNIYDLENSREPEQPIDATITVSDEDFYLIGCKQCSFEKLVAENKITTQGDPEAIKKMIEKFRLNASLCENSDN